MLNVKTPEEALAAVLNAFRYRTEGERVPLSGAAGRVLFSPVVSGEYVPDFDRSTVDGYAVRAADTFGCSESIPALLRLTGAVRMGRAAETEVLPGCCAAIPTGGALPVGADAAVMLEYAEDYGDGSVGIFRPAAPGMNLIRRGDDVSPGRALLPAGRRLNAPAIGALAALGVADVEVCRKPKAGILSTGDELVDASAVPGPGQVRDVNAPMLAALCAECGAKPRIYGIVPDDRASLGAALDRAMAECDLVLLSGGSSVGAKDAAAEVLGARGELLFHGIAMKPGKPTLAANCGGKPVFGLPGHPVAAFFAARLLVRPLLAQLLGETLREETAEAVLTESVAANDGRALYLGVELRETAGVRYAVPIRAKSGLITALARAVGYLSIPRDREGLAEGSAVRVTIL